MASSKKPDRFNGCYQRWTQQQKQDLEDLRGAFNQPAHDSDTLARLVADSVQHYRDYCDERAVLAAQDPHYLLAPTWCTPFENSFLWIAGCRPSMFVRLIYCLSGREIELQLSEYLAGVRTGNLGELTAKQLEAIDGLHRRTVEEEDMLSSRLASIQEDVSEEPLVRMASERGREWSATESNRAVEMHSAGLARLVVDADELRIRTAKDLVEVLTPQQAAHFLIAAKQLHLSMHEWGMTREEG
ncbi:hypothetical protein ACLOJK_010583 [Asimina triloba]